jgi:hypothetical protein
VSKTLESYLVDHPETMVGLAYFDLDLYVPTRRCLELLRSHMACGSVLAFDELNQVNFPGETRAVLEVFRIRELRFERFPYHASPVFVSLE